MNSFVFAIVSMLMLASITEARCGRQRVRVVQRVTVQRVAVSACAGGSCAVPQAVPAKK